LRKKWGEEKKGEKKREKKEKKRGKKRGKKREKKREKKGKKMRKKNATEAIRTLGGGGHDFRLKSSGKNALTFVLEEISLKTFFFTF